MPKQKSRRATAKRFKLTGSGKLRRNQAFHNHILTKKSPKRKRQLRPSAIVDKTDEGRILRQLGLC